MIALQGEDNRTFATHKLGNIMRVVLYPCRIAVLDISAAGACANNSAVDVKPICP
jgi:hypothetical protein